MFVYNELLRLWNPNPKKTCFLVQGGNHFPSFCGKMDGRSGEIDLRKFNPRENKLYNTCY